MTTGRCKHQPCQLKIQYQKNTANNCRFLLCAFSIVVNDKVSLKQSVLLNDVFSKLRLHRGFIFNNSQSISLNPEQQFPF